jgi:hypothetical protein
MMRVLWGQIAVDPELGATLGHEERDTAQHAYRTLLLRYRRSGEIRAGVDIEAVGNLLEAIGHYFGFLCQIAWQVDRDHVRALAKAAVADLCRGIEAPVAVSTERGTEASGHLSSAESDIVAVYRGGAPEVRALLDAAVTLAKSGNPA